jgi:chemotaxis response regulator CheB
VDIGASAGGLEALRQLLQALPPDTGLGYVIVQHLAPVHPSALAEILSRATAMPVVEVRDEPRVQPNHVYVIPPGRTMTIAQDAGPRPLAAGGFDQHLAKAVGHQALLRLLRSADPRRMVG